MKLSSGWINSAYSIDQERLLRRMLSPFVGLDQMVGTIVRGRREPRLHVMGGDLAGVHLLRGQERPKPGAYHIGGAGILLGESIIRTCGETAERYAQLVAEYTRRDEIEYGSYEEMRTRGKNLPSQECFKYFTEVQLAKQSLGLSEFDCDSVFAWVPAFSIPRFTETWVPAQAVFVGYVPKLSAGEPWLYPCMTTGTAVHTTYFAALRNALLELVQIDAAIGFWYTGRQTKTIIMDGAASLVNSLIERTLLGTGITARFCLFDFDIKNVCSVACILESSEGYPEAAVGLGIEFDAIQAMYKAFLEAIGVFQLAKITTVHDSAESGSQNDLSKQPDCLFDLDHNVKYYARPEHKSLLRRCFGCTETVSTANLVNSPSFSDMNCVSRLIAELAYNNIRLFVQDLSWNDIRKLGLKCVRIWSPDLLPMCLPSLPPAKHPRFAAFGEVSTEWPHPYA